MRFVRTTLVLLLTAATAAGAHAEPAKTREQVQAERREAIRTGDVYANGDSGLKLNELYPQRYRAQAAVPSKSRAEVRAELQDAIRNGELVVAGEGQTLGEQFPQRYPALAVAAGKTRDQVRAETLDAIRTGDMVAAGEGGLRLNEEYPQRYGNGRALYAAHSGPAAASAVAR